MAARAEELDPADLDGDRRRRCAAATCAAVLRIEHQVYPRRGRSALFLSELALPSTRVVPRRPGRRRRRRLRRADDRRRRRPRHDHRGRPGVAPARDRHPPAARAARARRSARGVARPHPRGADVATTARRSCTAASASPRPACARTTTPRRRGRAGDVGPRRRRRAEYADRLDAHRRRRPGRAPSSRAATVSRARRDAILGIETSCDETAAAVVDDGRDVLLVGRVEPGRPARPLRRRRARDRQPGPRRAAHAGRSPRRWSRRASSDRDIDAVAATTGPGLVGALLVGRQRGQGAGARVGRAVRRRQPPRGAPLRRASSRSPTLELPLVVLLVSGGHTMLVRDGGPRPLPAARPDARRRRRRGVRQGRPLPRPRLPGRPGHRPARRWRATRRPSPSPGPMLDDGLRLLVLRAQDRR